MKEGYDDEPGEARPETCSADLDPGMSHDETKQHLEPMQNQSVIILGESKGFRKPEPKQSGMTTQRDGGMYADALQ